MEVPSIAFWSEFFKNKSIKAGFECVFLPGGISSSLSHSATTILEKKITSIFTEKPHALPSEAKPDNRTENILWLA